MSKDGIASVDPDDTLVSMRWNDTVRAVAAGVTSSDLRAFQPTIGKLTKWAWQRYRFKFVAASQTREDAAQMIHIFAFNYLGNWARGSRPDDEKLMFNNVRQRVQEWVDRLHRPRPEEGAADIDRIGSRLPTPPPEEAGSGRVVNRRHLAAADPTTLLRRSLAAIGDHDVALALLMERAEIAPCVPCGGKGTHQGRGTTTKCRACRGAGRPTSTDEGQLALVAERLAGQVADCQGVCPACDVRPAKPEQELVQRARAAAKPTNAPQADRLPLVRTYSDQVLGGRPVFDHLRGGAAAGFRRHVDHYSHAARVLGLVTQRRSGTQDPTSHARQLARLDPGSKEERSTILDLIHDSKPLRLFDFYFWPALDDAPILAAWRELGGLVRRGIRLLSPAIRDREQVTHMRRLLAEPLPSEDRLHQVLAMEGISWSTIQRRAVSLRSWRNYLLPESVYLLGDSSPEPG